MRDGDALRSLVEDIQTLRCGSVQQRVVETLRSCWGKDARTCMYRPAATERGWTLETLYSAWDGEDAMLERHFEEYLNAAPFRFGTYDPLRPQSSQRNRARVDCPNDLSALHIRLHLFPKIGIADKWQLRALVCDGPVMLSWVGGFRDEPFGAREVRMLGKLVPALRARLRLEQVLGWNRLPTSELVDTLDRLSVPAFIVNRRGNIDYVNGTAESILAHDRAGVCAKIRRAIAPSAVQTGELSVARVFDDGVPTAYLVLMRTVAGDLPARADAARIRWGLTVREAEILRLIARGDANKDIATRLCLALATVEVHVSGILRKARVESRARLIVKFWTT